MPKTEKTAGFYVKLMIGCGAVLPLLWIVREWSGCANGICNVSGTPPEWDFTSFWEAGRLAIARNFYAIANFQDFRETILSRLHYDIGQSAFIYSPVSYPFFAVFGFFPLPLAYCLWIVAGTSILLSALRLAGLSWLFCGFVLASPAFLYNLLLGQNGAFTAGVLILAMVCTGKHPWSAGIFGACLIFKPQLALVVPFMWLRRGNRIAIAGAVCAGLSLLGLSLIIFGVLPWRLYFAQQLPAMKQVLMAPFPQAYQVNSITLFSLLRAVGISALPAEWLQGLASLAAAAATFTIWHRNSGIEHKFCLTMMLVLLAMPYGYVYDMVGYSAALALVAQQRGSSLPWAIFWLWPAIERIVTLEFGLPLTPLVVFAAVIWLAGLPAIDDINTAHLEA